MNIFDVFLPQLLLLYPNPTDPLNGEAAALLMRDPTTYKQRVQDYVKRYAQLEGGDLDRLGMGGNKEEDESSSEGSDLGKMSDSDDNADGMEL